MCVCVSVSVLYIILHTMEITVLQQLGDRVPSTLNFS